MTEYSAPANLDEALDLLASHPGRARILAGGTDLLLDLRSGKKQAQALVDITRIPDLNRIWNENGLVEIGAAVTFAAIRENEYFKNRLPMLTEAAGSVGARGIQTTATWVGNLVQAMPAGDGAIVALALEAEAQVVEIGKSEWWPVSRLFAGPGKSAINSTRQIVTHLRFKIPATAWGAAWQRLGRRSALTLPTINCAVKVEIENGRIRQAVIALGPVAATPFRAREAESFLVGKLPVEKNLAEAGAIARDESNPRDNPLRASREYRLAILPVMVRRALNTAVKSALELTAKEF